MNEPVMDAVKNDVSTCGRIGWEGIQRVLYTDVRN